MRFSSYALPALAANLIAALPSPQDIDLDMVADTPDPTYSEAVGVTAQTIVYNSASLVAAASAAASSVSIDVSDVLSQTAVVSKRAAPTAATICAPQPSGAASAPTYAAADDSAANFLANTYYASVASAAPTPTGYNVSFVAQQASSNAFGFMGFDTFDTYDVATCASRCSAKSGCVSFNMYYERDPSVNPNDASCSNPSSVTMIKCAYWGGPVTLQNAVQKGQTRGQFVVAIAGSNGYTTTKIQTPAGFQAGIPYGKYAINAPYDAQGYNTFMGSKIFTSTWDVASCAAYCDSQTAYNKATAPKDGTPYKVCNFFNTYVLTAYKADGSVVPQGQYCALYTEAWPATYATNGGQWRGSDQYLVSYSFGYPKLDAGISPTVGDAKGAVYQAVADLKWSSLQPFCSTLLSYTTAVTTVTSTSTAYSTTVYAPLGRRAAQTTPVGLSKYPATVISSACSMVATSPTITSTVAATTTTAYVPTSTAYINAPLCNPANAEYGALNQGGCQSNINYCFCNLGADGNAFCVDGGSGDICNVDSDCPSGEFCDQGDATDSDGIRFCASGASCSSSYSPFLKRDLSGFGGMPRVGRTQQMKRDEGHIIIGPNEKAVLRLVQAGSAFPSVGAAMTSIASAVAAAAATSTSS